MEEWKGGVLDDEGVLDGEVLDGRVVWMEIG